MKRNLYIVFFFFGLFFNGHLLAQGFSYLPGKVKHRFSAGPVITFYYNHSQMTANTKRKLGASVSYKMELIFRRRTNMLVGLEYMSQGLVFNGYYKAPGSTYLFDKSFPYTHELRYNELQVPFGLKLAMNRESESPATPYVLGGVGARYIFNSYVVITNDSTGTSPYDGKGDIGFEHEFVAKKLNAFFWGGLGFQKNKRDSAKAFFIEFILKYGISRIHYSGYQNSNNLNIKEPSLAITLGFRL